MELVLNRTESSNRYCVPAALALITGLSVDSIIELLREELVDQPISGIYYPLGLKILQKLGWKYKRIEHFRPDLILGTDKIYYCTNSNHCFVLHDGRYWDNSNPNGAEFKAMSRHAITQCCEVWR